MNNCDSYLTYNRNTMDPSPQNQNAAEASSSSNPPPNNDDNASTTKPVKNKRTKTGCLTCRKRRIKCDEGRPNCSNCKKSKKECQYSTFTFRQQTGIVRDSFHGNADPRFGNIGGSSRGQYPRLPARSTLTPIAPRPPHMSAETANQISQYGPPRHLHSTQEAITPQPSADDMAFSLSGNIPPIGPGRLLPNPLHNPAFRMRPDVQNQCFGGSSQQSNFHQPSQNSQNTDVHGYSAPGTSTSGGMSTLDSDFDETLDDSDDEMEHFAGKSFAVSAVTPLPRPKPIGSRSAPGIPKSNALFAYMDYPRDSDARTEGMKVMLSHFINITSPTITLYEKHSDSRPSGYKNNKGKEKENDDKGKGTEMMRDGRHFWSYILPVLSLHHPGLLQAMLALANVQVANVQDAYPTVAMKHYHLAIQRLRQNISSPRKTQIATLATALLLAYFEVWTSDHSRWCKHLLGARFILLDIPLRVMTKKCWYYRVWKQQYPENELDMDLLSRITGYTVDYGIRRPSFDYGIPTELEVREYENYADLYWWYCKMDVYQSILSGRPLLMHYPAWTQCPPRASVNMPKDVYGTYDHLVLLLGRVADFTVRDKKRKTEAWKLKRQGPPGSKGSPNQYPGILPTTGFIPTPAGFDTSRSSRNQPHGEERGHFRTLDEAMNQWQQIKEAFAYLKSKLWTTGFRPLSTEFADNRDSLFGPAIQHSSYAISGFWMNYYMGLICLQRAHPTMPPAPLEAVGMAARDTAKWAAKIPRIAVGMMEDTSKLADISTIYAASLIESTFCLFVAGVQFQDAKQREWLVRRMDDTSRLTGFSSARNVADGCETGWQKADTIRQRPVYQKRQDRRQGGTELRRRSRAEIESRPRTNSEMLLLESADQAFLALGLLSLTEDLERFEITDELPEQ